MFGFEKSPGVPYGTGAFNQAKDTHMIRTIGAAALLSLALTMPAQQAAAQDPFSVLGGAAAGAIIGGATGAILSAEAERRRGGYYWWNDGCYVRAQGGWVRVSRRYCY